MYLYLCLVFVFICKKQPTLLSWWSRGISIWIFLVFVFVFVSDICIYFCPHGKSSPYCFFGGAREGKADYLQSPNVSYKMCCFIIFWLFENLQPWSWGYNWGRAPTSNILRLVGCTRKHISNIRWCLFFRSCSSCQIFFIFRLHQNVSTLAELMQHTQWHPSNQIRNTEVASVYKVWQFSRK